MTAFLIWLESSAFSVWLRESPSFFAFPGILCVHTIGMGFAAGTSAAIDLRVLGFAPRVPLMQMQRFFPVMWFGFWINAVSGIGLLIAYPTKALTNPLFYFKLALIAVAVIDTGFLKRKVFSSYILDESPVSTNGRLLAVLSLACWAGAITAGRLLAYTYTQLLSI